MKTEILKNYGVSGVKVEFNLMDCYEATHAKMRIEVLKKVYEEEGTLDAEEAMVFFCNFDALLSKIALEPSQMPSIFIEDKDEEKECY